MPSNKIERKSYLKVVGTTRQAYEVLNRMARYQNDLHNLNYNLIFQIKLELDSLTYHEQILKSLSKKLVTMWNILIIKS